VKKAETKGKDKQGEKYKDYISSVQNENHSISSKSALIETQSNKRL